MTLAGQDPTPVPPPQVPTPVSPPPAPALPDGPPPTIQEPSADERPPIVDPPQTRADAT